MTVNRTEDRPGVTRIRLRAEDAPLREPVIFEDRKGEYLRLTEFRSEPRPVYQLEKNGGTAEVRQTANGEVVSVAEGERRLKYVSRSATLRFACPAGEILTGLGQHEDGIFDYARENELLYQHNMKISVPFLLSSAGWGLLIGNGCAMRYEGYGDGFTFYLDAAREVSLTVIRGENCAAVLETLSALTGRPALLPKWAYGYIQSKERYQTARELTDTAREFRRRGLGLDCIVLDWMSWQEGCWGDKTPDPARFPDIRALTGELHDMKVHFMVSVWPNISKGRDRDEFEAAGEFLPASQTYDAFSPAARELYWTQCRRYWVDGGADALWCDSCEPMTDPDWCGSEKREPRERMRLILEASETRMDPENMNDYGAEHLRGLREHWVRDVPGKRPVFLSRSGGMDSASLGAILWSGDVCARWDVLRRQVTEGIRAACSGLAWWTLDIGGFFVSRQDPWFWRGDYPDGVTDPGYRELYLRWFQFGSMLPVFRSHGTDTPREPWAFGGEDSPEYRCLKKTMELRYRLLPYLYSCAAQTCRTGIPMLRAMMVAFGEDAEARKLGDQYMLGDALLVRPVTKPLAEGGGRTEVYLPAGGWYDLFTLRFYSGGGWMETDTPAERFPLFVRAGSILPLAEGAQCAAEAEAREILVFRGADGRLDWYDDAGDGPADGKIVTLQYDEASGTLRGETCLPVRYIGPETAREEGPACCGKQTEEERK